jgi:hypothetical protein
VVDGGVEELLLIEAVRDVVRSGSFILGARCAELEASLAADQGLAHGVATASPRAALLLSLTVLGVGEETDARGVEVDDRAPAFAAGTVGRVGGVVVAGSPVRIDAPGPGVFRVVRAGSRDAAEILVLDLGPASPAAGVADAAMLLTDSDALAGSLRMLRNHGQDGRTRFLHHVVGYNARMDEVAATYLLARRSAVA